MVRIVLAGLGGHGRTIRNAIAESQRFNVVAVFDPNEAEAQAAAAQFGCEVAGGFEEMLNIEGLQAVSLATPNKLHHQQIRQALDRGLHVFVEKPITETVAEAKNVVQWQHESGKIVMVGQNMRYGKAERLAKDYLESGTLGEIISLDIHFSAPSLRFMPENSWRLQTTMLPMVQLGIHAIDLVHFWLSDVIEVSATARSVHTPQGIYDNVVALLRLENGMLGTMTSNYNTQVAFLLHIAGTQGSLRCTPHKVWFRACDKTNGEGEGEATVHDFTNISAESYTNQFYAFAHAIETNTLPPTDALAGLKALAVVEAMQRSIASEVWETVEN